jgi:myo-inositol catabolism protein IolH
MERILPELERHDLTLSIEPHPGDFEETTAGALELLDGIGSRHVRYLHCLPHAFYLGGEPAEQIIAATGRFDHVHLADGFRPERSIVNPRGLDYRVHQHFDIGHGEIDWPGVVAALHDCGFDGLASVQVFGWPERWADSFAHNREQLRRLFVGSDQ